MPGLVTADRKRACRRECILKHFSRASSTRKTTFYHYLDRSAPARPSPLGDDHRMVMRRAALQILASSAPTRCCTSRLRSRTAPSPSLTSTSPSMVILRAPRHVKDWLRPTHAHQYTCRPVSDISGMERPDRSSHFTPNPMGNATPRAAASVDRAAAPQSRFTRSAPSVACPC